MCGIAGILYFDRQRLVPQALLKSMTDAQAHRGPDDEGHFLAGNVGLGHRRLSIIDLSGGHQPITDETGSCTIVFNGEIYNYLDVNADLKRKGHSFKSKSDTETILRAYLEYGEDCVTHLNGMFAFAIWDARTDKLFLARDRAGKKPLYYYADKEKLVFASELKSILLEPSVPRQIDPVALDAYFRHMYVPDPLTIFQGIRKLPTASILICKDQATSIRKYWNIRYETGASRREEDYVEELRSLMDDAVKIRLMSEVPLGVFLSGGVDSSSITGLMAKHSVHKVKTFSIKGGEGVFNELPYARAVAEMYGTEHHEFEVKPERMETLLPRLIGYFDEPFADSSAIPTYHVSKLAREKVTVALSGEGGDELFAGYTWHKTFMTLQKMRGLLAVGAKTGLSGWLPDSNVPTVNQGSVKRLLYRLDLARRLSLPSGAETYQSMQTSFHDHMANLVYGDGLLSELKSRRSVDPLREAFEDNNASDDLDRALNADINVYLPGDLLTKVDRMSMANSLEVRAPLLDYRIIEFSARVPASLKLHNGTSKYILKKAMENVLPDAVKNRKTKRGFSIPVEAWFRGDLKEYARETLLGAGNFNGGYLKKSGIATMLDEHASGRRNYGPQLWALLVFELWGRQCAGK